MLVSEHRADAMRRWTWHPYSHNGRTTYARRYVPGRPFPHNTVTAHRQIAGYPGADHANGNGLDNRDRNLRKATPAQQAANQGTRSDNTSGYRGVVWNKGKWLARIKTGGKQRYLGRFDDPADAARAWNDAASAQWPGFARLNVIPQPPGSDRLGT
jgi:hypothetical protein